MDRNKIALITLLTILIGFRGYAQIFKESGINIGANAGGAVLITELTSNNKSIKEFTNKPGFASGLEISKVIIPHLEMGLSFNYSNLKGNTDKTDHFSAIGFHSAFMDPLSGPTEYDNNLTGPGIFVRYYLLEAMEKSVFNPFVKVSFDFIAYKSTFKYVGSDETIFGKGDENQPDLSTGKLSLGTGFKTSLSDHVYLLTSIDLNFVKYDFLDVVHNYDDVGNRRNITGLYTEFKVGIFYNSSKSGSSSGSSRKKGNKSGKNETLPFAR